MAIDFSQAKLTHLAVHAMGNAGNGEGVILSDAALDWDLQLEEELLKAISKPFREPEFFGFTGQDDLPIRDACHGFCMGSLPWLPFTIQLATQLYEVSTHPAIQPGEVLFTAWDGLRDGDRMYKGLGIAKSESKNAVLKVARAKNGFSLQRESGIQVELLDKVALVLMDISNHTFKICQHDRQARQQDARYWKEDFLQLEPLQDAFHHTQRTLSMTREFVAEQLPNDFHVEKADQINLLNRSLAYFKENDAFNRQEFAQEVLQDGALIERYQAFEETYSKKHEQDVPDQFAISDAAVRKQARVFKSVLKLDRNFHVYIHGDRSLIERGTEPDGRKFYKIYFEQEL